MSLVNGHWSLADGKNPWLTVLMNKKQDCAFLFICQTFDRALEIYDAEMARQYAGKQEVLRIDRRTVLFMFGMVTFSRRLVRREGRKPFYP